MADLEKLIREMDWTALNVAKAEGAKAIPRIEPFLKDQEPHRRSLAVDCLRVIGGPQAQELMVRALEDPYEHVRAYALAGLHANPPAGREKELGGIFDRATKDPYVRQQVPMILGRIPGPDALSVIVGRAGADLAPDVQDGIISGRARHGDRAGREQFAGLMRDARGLRVGRLLDFVRYQDDKWVLPLLSLWIDGRDLALRLSDHEGDILRRACDVAVDEARRLTAGKKDFSFPPRLAEPYKDAEIREVREYLASLGKSPYLKD